MLGGGVQEVHEFDVVGHPKANFHFCVTFPFHPAPDGKEAQVGSQRAG